MSRSIGLFGLLWLALCVMAGIVGCAVPAASGTSITIHTWRQVTWAPTAPWPGAPSGMYTYVLIGDIPTGGGDDAKRTRAALARLLAVVQATQRAPTQSFPGVMAAYVNQFAVPTKAGVPPEATVSIEQYDFALAANYRRWFQVITADDPALGNVLNGPGPYLVATRVPLALLIAANGDLRAVVGESPVLVMDMSGRTEAAVPYYVDGFKAAVAKAQPGSAKLAPMKGTIVDYVVAANQALPMLAEFWSKTRKSFEG